MYRNMKYFYLGITAVMYLSAFSQELPDKIIFDYDSSGNQIFRGIVIEFSRTAFMEGGYSFEKEGVEETNRTPEKKGYSSSRLTYYPNPVRDVLNIEWDDNFKKVDYIVVNTPNGQRLVVVPNLSESISTSLDFVDLPTGVYYLTVVYMDRTEEIIKVIKK